MIRIEDFLNNSEMDVFTFGRPPVAINIMTKVKGLDFDTVYMSSELIRHEELDLKLVQYNSLLKAKKSSARLKDLNDIKKLEEE